MDISSVAHGYLGGQKHTYEDKSNLCDFKEYQKVGSGDIGVLKDITSQPPA